MLTRKLFLFVLLFSIYSTVSHANTQQVDLPPNQWHQISFPFASDSVGNTVANILGDDLPLATYGSEWKLFAYNPSTLAYTALGVDGQLKRGVSYWVIQNTAQTVTLDFVDQTPISASAFEIPLTTQVGTHSWNMIGYPLDISISLNSIVIKTDSGICGDADGCTLMEAEQANIFNANLYSYNGVSSYDIYNNSGGISILSPWKGYWVATLAGAHGLNPRIIFPPQVSWSSAGPGGGGWLSAITVIPDATNTVYVGCDVGGIYKSTDHGQTWKIKNKGISMYYVQDIAYDQTNSNTLYAATRGGIYKSTNGGDDWVLKRFDTPETPPESQFTFSTPVSDIEVDPSNPGTLYAGIGITRSAYVLDSYHWQTAGIKGAIYKSTNYGESWALIRNGIDSDSMIYSLAIDPGNSNILYAATSTGVYKSSNAGVTWLPKNTDLPHQRTMALAINPQNSNILYVTLWAEPGISPWKGGIYKSVDGGDSWDVKNSGLPKISKNVEGLTSNYPVLVIDKSNPQILYLGNNSWTPDPGVYKTTDGGNNWAWVSRLDSDDNNVNTGWIHEGAVVKTLAIDPNNLARLYFGTSTDLITTDNAGLSWYQTYTEEKAGGYWKGHGFETTVVADIVVDPENSNTIYAGYWDMGFLKSIDGGASFKRTSDGLTYGSNTFAIILDPDNSSIIYAANGLWEENKGAVYKSTNSGEDWVLLGSGLPDAQIWSIALDKDSPIGSRILYATSYDNGVYKTTDGGQNWFPVNNGLGINSNLQVKKILIDPNHSNVLYAGIEAKQIESGNTNSTIQGGLFKSTNGGELWTRIDSSLPQINVWDIAIDPSNSQNIYTAVKAAYDHSQQNDFLGGVYKSTDGGTTWTNEKTGFGDENNLNISSVTIDPTQTNTLYATTTDAPFHDRSAGRGIFRSTDAGKNWLRVSNESNIQDFETITIDPLNPFVLYAGSSGNGILKGIDNRN